MVKQGEHNLKIVFMGTPEFAVASLDAMLNEGFNIVGVITAPDKPAGRGQKLQQSAVKQYAVEKGLNILQPTNLKNPDFQAELKSLNADIQVVIAFRMLPETVWSMPPMGTFNLHASLLPQYRGAAPINWAVINGEKETGVTTFFLKHEIDTGDILFQEKVAIGENTTAGELHDSLMEAGAELVVKTLNAIEEGNYKEIPQADIPDAKHAPKIFKEDCKIDWTKEIQDIHNHIRGLSPYPAAWTKLGGKNLKVFNTTKEVVKHTQPIGIIDSDNKTYIKVAVNGGYLNIHTLQLEGKKRMETEEFLRGFDISQYKKMGE